jgi:paraquat-inducible protein A
MLLALGALALYGPGILLPALHVEKLGRCRESGILDGCTWLLTQGEVFLGVVVGLSAVVLPPLKLTLLLWLAAAPAAGVGPGRRRSRLLEIIGRFSCLEVFLAAVLITFVRLNALLCFQALAGLYFFGLSALLGLAASGALSLGFNLKENSYESRPCHV